ncbi:hypothetical protein GCM10009609_68910 [Pseudonocardia aurantiaca]
MLPQIDMHDSLNTNKLVATIAAIWEWPRSPRGRPGASPPVVDHEGTLAMLMRTDPFRELD